MRDKVMTKARELGLDVTVQSLERSTATTGDAAKAVGCEEGEIAKSLVFICDGEPIICIASGAHRVDIGRLAEIFDCAEVRQAAPDEVTAATGYKVGGVPPFGHDLPVVLDEDLLHHDRVWAAGGDGHSLFEVDPRRLADCVSATVASIV